MSLPSEPTPAVETAEPRQALVTITNAVYLLQAIGILVTPVFVAAVIVNYVKRDEVRGTFLESHFRWQMRTFWFGLLWAVVGVLTMVLLIGYAILLANVIWVMYRVIKGWLDLVDRKPMYRSAPSGPTA